MKSTLALLPFAFAISCVAENTPSPAPEKPPAVEENPAEEAPPSFDVNKPESLIGHPHAVVKAACDAAKIPNRVIERDGQPLPATSDYRPNRLNFAVKDGKITAVSKG